MFDRIRRRKRRNRKEVPRDLPPTVRFDVIDYEGERLYLAVPIVATVTMDAGDVFIFNDEACVRGSGPTLEEAMEDFCGSFLLCYKILLKGGPGCNRAWGPIMLHVYGWRRSRTDAGDDRSGPYRASRFVLTFRASSPTKSPSVGYIAGPYPVHDDHVRQDP